MKVMDKTLNIMLTTTKTRGTNTALIATLYLKKQCKYVEEKRKTVTGLLLQRETSQKEQQLY